MNNLIEQYMILHREKPSYGRGATYLWKIIKLCEEYDLNNAIDFGCGKGALANAMTQEGVLTMKYDPAIQEFSESPESILSQLGMDRVDLLVANDVFEHFDPTKVHAELERINGLARVIFANISCRPATQILPDGRNAHTTLKDRQGWMATCNNAFKNKAMILLEWHPRNQNLVIAYADYILINSLTGKKSSDMLY